MKEKLMAILDQIWKWILAALRWLFIPPIGYKQKPIRKRTLFIIFSPVILLFLYVGGMVGIQYLAEDYWENKFFKSYPDGKVYYISKPDVVNNRHEVYQFQMVYYPNLTSSAYKEAGKHITKYDQRSEWIIFEVEYSHRKGYLRVNSFLVVYSFSDMEGYGGRKVKGFPMNQQKMVDKMLPKDFAKDFKQRIEQSFVFRCIKFFS